MIENGNKLLVLIYELIEALFNGPRQYLQIMFLYQCNGVCLWDQPQYIFNCILGLAAEFVMLHSIAIIKLFA